MPPATDHPSTKRFLVDSQRSLRTTVGLLLLCAVNAFGQSYTCPEKPTWYAAACSVYAAFTPGTGEDSIAYYLREGRPHEKYARWVMEMEGIPNIELLIWHGHYSDERYVAELVASSVAILPAAVLRALPENTVISLDIGSGGGAIYWDLPKERAHAVEFAAAFAHESANTLDWSFEELLLHEFGHVFDVGLYSIRTNPEWIAATQRDNSASVTRYAETNDKETFAETFAAWMAYRRDQARPIESRKLTPEHNDHILTTIGNRGKWLDEQIVAASSSPNGRLFANLSWKGDDSTAVSGKRAVTPAKHSCDPAGN